MIRNFRAILLTLLILNIGQSSEQSIDTCDFTGQCVYNVEVSHCANTTTRILRTSTDCSCTDAEHVEGDIDRMASVIRQVKDRFNSVSSELRLSFSQLNKKKEHLRNLRDENTKLQHLYESASFNLNATTADLQRAKEDWATEVARLKDALNKTTNSAHVCQTTLTASQTATTTGDSNIHMDFCGFEEANYCGYTQDHDENTDWSRGSGRLVASTGPRMDHTYGSPVGHYMYINAHGMTSSSSSLKTARLSSPTLPPSSGYCLRFWYNMYGADIQTIHVYAKVGSGLGYPVFTHTGQIDKDWHLAQVNLDSEYTRNHFKFVFEATSNAYRSSYYSSGRVYSRYHNGDGDIAIDDVYLFNTSCIHASYSECPSGAHIVHGGSSTTCYTIHATPSTWYEASKICRMENVFSHLVSVTSGQEQQSLIRFITGNQTLATIGQNGFYTSGNDEHSEHSFVWTDSGTPYNFTYTNWHPGQPNNVGGNQNCVLLQYADADYEWGDVQCTEKHPFICEINK